MKLAKALAVLFVAIASSAAEKKFWYGQPAGGFQQALPLDNGRLGAMVLGGVDEEWIVLDESCVWSGSRGEADRLDACKSLPEIRQLLCEGKKVEADELETGPVQAL